jgi:hypothetical protein
MMIPSNPPVFVDMGIKSIALQMAKAAAQRQKKDKEMTDHAAAAAEALEKVIAMLKAGQSPEDLGPMVVLIGRMMARRT